MIGQSRYVEVRIKCVYQDQLSCMTISSKLRCCILDGQFCSDGIKLILCFVFADCFVRYAVLLSTDPIVLRPRSREIFVSQPVSAAKHY